MPQVLDITQDIDDPTKVIRFEGRVNIAKNVKLVRLQGIYATHGDINFNGKNGSTIVDVDALTVDDPRDLSGVPTDGFHLGGISGHIGLLKGTRLQRDLAKAGQGTNN